MKKENECKNMNYRLHKHHKIWVTTYSLIGFSLLSGATLVNTEQKVHADTVEAGTNQTSENPNETANQAQPSQVNVVNPAESAKADAASANDKVPDPIVGSDDRDTTGNSIVGTTATDGHVIQADDVATWEYKYSEDSGEYRWGYLTIHGGTKEHPLYLSNKPIEDWVGKDNQKLPQIDYTYTGQGSKLSIGVDGWGVGLRSIKIDGCVKFAGTSASKKFENLAGLGDFEGYNNIITTGVTDMSYMFANIQFIGELSFVSDQASGVWDVSQVTDFSHMFEKSMRATTDYNSMPSFVSTLTFSGWKIKDTGSANINMTSMFEKCHAHMIFGIENWHTNKVKQMASMFNGANCLAHLSLKHQDNIWDVSQVTDFSYMFAQAIDAGKHDFKDDTTPAQYTYTIDVTGWNFRTSGPTDINMTSMFDGSSAEYIKGISQWNTGHAAKITAMFSGTRYLVGLKLETKGDIWNVSHISDFSNVFAGAINCLEPKNKVNPDPDNIPDHIINIDNWDTSGEKANVTGPTISMANMFGSVTITQINWISNGIEFVPEKFDYENGCHATKIIGIEKLDTHNVNNMSHMFSCADKLSDLAIKTNPTGNNKHVWNVSHVTDFSHMFADAIDSRQDGSGSYAIDVTGWDTGAATNMSDMFGGATSVKFAGNHGTVTDYGCQARRILGIEKFDTHQVTNMTQMFWLADKLEDLSLDHRGDIWDVNGVKNFTQMFNETINPDHSNQNSKYAISVKNWNLNQAGAADINMTSMFDTCQASTLPGIETWNVDKVNNMSYMFWLHNHLQRLDLHNWDTQNVMDMTGMFAFNIKDASQAKNNLHRLNLGGKFDTTKALAANKLIGFLAGVGSNSTYQDTGFALTLGPKAKLGSDAFNYKNKLTGLKMTPIYEITGKYDEKGPVNKSATYQTKAADPDDPDAEAKLLHHYDGTDQGEDNYLKLDVNVTDPDLLSGKYDHTFVSWPVEKDTSAKPANNGNASVVATPAAIKGTPKTLWHNGYIYDKNGNRDDNLILKRDTVVMTYGTTVIKGRKFYNLSHDVFVAAGNIDDQVRTLGKKANVYDKYGERSAMPALAKGTRVKTHGDPVTMHHKEYYQIGDNEFIRKVNVLKAKKTPQRPGYVSEVNNGKLKHNGWIYEKDPATDTYKRTNKVILKLDSKCYAAISMVVNGKKFYEFGDPNDRQLIKASNIDGTKRKLTKNAYIYNQYGKRVGEKRLKRGQIVRTYGGAIRIKYPAYYTIGKNRYVKRTNFR